MKWKPIKELSVESFRRLTGVKRQTFEKMAGLIEEALAKKKIRGGRPNKLAVGEATNDFGIFKRISYLFRY